ncbi:MAG TPA: thioredoxin-disulfide reductase [Lachnospiraceae bacterium]|jgi:thioredoxin reductase (NADPH)|nr:thioredoxin-disulfide reductase [Lachnospiraceae bacterium]HCA70610.1 thioredoxin-disulfide reductase [Lachnospiraceae bacterium]HCM13404.1 thioredoxin-disulfide reductase [Lachnospiraceae bacterium]HCR40004.1 thioredoxin-disulfide reductase [Lachnospiraceae bacterium]
MTYDVIIIGSGPAGLAAAIYAKRSELTMLVIEKAAISGGQIINTYEVDNYPGFMGISGFDLSMKFREHADKLGTEFVTGEVKEFRLDGDTKVITLDDGTIYRAKAVIIATGGVPRHLHVEGEEKLSGMGVSYCATCDGAFFKNKTVAVAGGGDVAVEDAIFLARICKKVYVVHRRDQFRAKKSLATKLLSMENVTVLWDSVVEKINGKEAAESISIKNVKTGERSTLEVSGVFIAVGYIPNSEIFRNVVATDDRGYIIAGENSETNVPGIFAAGDVRTKGLRQIITAASDGAVAVTAVEKYLNDK